MTDSSFLIYDSSVNIYNKLYIKLLDTESIALQFINHLYHCISTSLHNFTSRVNSFNEFNMTKIMFYRKISTNLFKLNHLNT